MGDEHLGVLSAARMAFATLSRDEPPLSQEQAAHRQRAENGRTGHPDVASLLHLSLSLS